MTHTATPNLRGDLPAQITERPTDPRPHGVTTMGLAMARIAGFHYSDLIEPTDPYWATGWNHPVWTDSQIIGARVRHIAYSLIGQGAPSRAWDLALAYESTLNL